MQGYRHQRRYVTVLAKDQNQKELQYLKQGFKGAEVAKLTDTPLKYVTY